MPTPPDIDAPLPTPMVPPPVRRSPSWWDRAVGLVSLAAVIAAVGLLLTHCHVSISYTP